MKVYRLFENKDKYINRNSNLTDDQKEEIKNTLKRYSYLEGNVDWNKSDTFKLLLTPSSPKALKISRCHIIKKNFSA